MPKEEGSQPQEGAEKQCDKALRKTEGAQLQASGPSSTLNDQEPHVYRLSTSCWTSVVRDLRASWGLQRRGSSPNQA